MSYTVTPYLLKIDDLKKAVGSKDRALMLAALKKKVEDYNDKFDENLLDSVNETEEDDDDENEWKDDIIGVKALVNGDLKNPNIRGDQYSFGLEVLCRYLGEREFVEPLESVHSSDYFDDIFPWLFAKKPPVPFTGYEGDFPVIGYLRRKDIPKELERTKALQFDQIVQPEPTSHTPNPQEKLEWKLFFSNYETVPANPADFPWLTESYYDSVQQELESLGFQKTQDKELLHISRLLPKIRNFYRTFINAERNIGASVCQVRVVKPQNDNERAIDVRIVEFTTEFSDGTFYETANSLGVNTSDNFEGVTMQQFPPDTPAEKLLAAHKEVIEKISKSKKVEIRTHATDEDLQATAERQFLLARADRRKKRMASKEPRIDTRLLEYLEEVRAGLLELYEKALAKKTDIVTFYY